MLYNNELNFKILTVDRFKHKKGKTAVKPRPYASLGYRVSGKGEFSVNNKGFISAAGNVLFIPQNAAYDVSYSGGESIVVHLINCNYFCAENFEITGSADVQRLFLDLLSMKNDYSKANAKKAIVYNIFQMLSDNAVVSAKTNTDVSERCKRFIDEHFCECDLHMIDVCKEVNISESTLRRIFSAFYGIPPKKYLVQRRLEKAVEMLIEDEKSVKEVAAMCGFDDEKYFSRVIKKKYGCAPSEIKKYI